MDRGGGGTREDLLVYRLTYCVASICILQRFGIMMEHSLLICFLAVLFINFCSGCLGFSQECLHKRVREILAEHVKQEGVGVGQPPGCCQMELLVYTVQCSIEKGGQLVRPPVLPVAQQSSWQ